MAAERRQQISDLYHGALARAPEERAAYLMEACNGDEGLRQEVESLLEFESASARFLERPGGVVATDGTSVTPMIDRQIGPYRIVAPLGAGGMGEVYRARDSKLGRDVAIKMLPSHFTADPERRARFAREARTLATLNHPHIGAIYGLEESDGVSALVLELVEGQTLADRLERGPLPPPQALAIARQIAEALDAAHEKGIVHRDLKPANIVLQGGLDGLSTDVRAKVLDFGLAKPMAVDLAAGPTAPATGSFDGTALGRILGTPAYMSPEQARGLTVDKRTDIWAFGCVLFEMLAGKRAFIGETSTDTFAQILEREPDWTILPVATPSAVRSLLQRCLRKDPRRRLHDIADALIEMEDVAEPRLAVGAEHGSSAAAVGEPHRRSRQRFAWLAIGTLSVALVVTGAAALQMMRARPVQSVEPTKFRIFAPQGAVFEQMPYIAVSPDGRLVVFTASSGGVVKLWVKLQANPEATPMPGTEGAVHPFWSPDSQFVAYFARGGLWKVPAGGGRPERIADAPAGRGGTWNRDNVIVFAPATDGPLLKVSATGGPPTSVTTVDKTRRRDTFHRLPHFLPDGTHFLFAASGGPTPAEIQSASLDSGEGIVATGIAGEKAMYSSGHLLYTRQGSLVAHPFDATVRQATGQPVTIANDVSSFSVSASNLIVHATAATNQLTWVDRTGRPLGTVSDLSTFMVALSQDDRQVATTNVNDLVLFRLGHGTGARKFTSAEGLDFFPVWSPGGLELVFASTRNGRYQIYRKSADFSSPEVLVLDDSVAPRHLIAPTDWSRDGNFVAYTKSGPARTEIWIRPMSGSRAPFRFRQSPGNDGNAHFSPNGRWIAFKSDEGGDRSEIYVAPFPGPGAVHQVSAAGGTQPSWSFSGRELFYFGPDGALMAATVDENAPAFKWSAARRLFAKSVNLSVGMGNEYAVDRDGSRFLINVLSPPQPLTVILDWLALARR